MEPRQRRLAGLTPAESMRLLSEINLGRVVFTHRALPAIMPANHIVDRDAIVIRSHSSSAIVKAAHGSAVVAYEADDIDRDTWLGWSVVVTGVARRVWDAAAAARYDGLLVSWVDGARHDFIRITPELVSGYRLE
jgi:nitroimidazol reductase NimA-like FMN-containing flavoprotein (pyridoxamine 5'-phosphate oxidase superfamily)